MFAAFDMEWSLRWSSLRDNNLQEDSNRYFKFYFLDDFVYTNFMFYAHTKSFSCSSNVYASNYIKSENDSLIFLSDAFNGTVIRHIIPFKISIHCCMCACVCSQDRNKAFLSRFGSFFFSFCLLCELDHSTLSIASHYRCRANLNTS